MTARLTAECTIAGCTLDLDCYQPRCRPCHKAFDMFMTGNAR